MSDLKKEVEELASINAGGNFHDFTFKFTERLANLAEAINVSKGFDSDAELVEELNCGDGLDKCAARRIEELNTAVQISLVADEAFEALREHRRREPDDKMFDELGDVLIRVLGIFGKHRRDPGEVIFRILNKNIAREFKHGNRRY